MMNDLPEDQFDDDLKRVFDDDYRVPDPTDSHLHSLRNVIRQHTVDQDHRYAPGATDDLTDSVLPSPVCSAKPWLYDSRTGLRYLLAASVAILVIGLWLAQPYMGNATASWNQSLQVTRQATWIHGTIQIQPGHGPSEIPSTTGSRPESSSPRSMVSGPIVAESWCSPGNQLSAFRSPQIVHLYDGTTGTHTHFRVGDKVAYRWASQDRNAQFGREFIRTLLAAGDLQSCFPMHDVSPVRKTILNDQRVRYSFQVRQRKDPDQGWDSVVETDPISGRIDFWKDHHHEGTVVQTRFDYPDHGPLTIFELGVPRDSEIVIVATPPLPLPDGQNH